VSSGTLNLAQLKTTQLSHTNSFIIIVMMILILTKYNY